MGKCEATNAINRIKTKSAELAHRHHETIDHRVGFYFDGLAGRIILGEAVAKIPEKLGSPWGSRSQGDIEKIIITPVHAVGDPRERGCN